jgi:hypothetical protein
LRALVHGLAAFALSLVLAARAEAFEPGDLVSPPAEHVDAMHLLAAHDLHNLNEEWWTLAAQFTYISSWKPAFRAEYTNQNGSINSLLPTAERSFTGTLTFMFGVRLWHGAEGYLVPEIIAERPFSTLRGLGGAIQNFELQKTGVESPQLYRSRGWLKQTIGLGGERVHKASDQGQLGATVDARRVVISVGNFSIIDFFDKNTFSTNPRQQFLNMVFMTHAAYDFASDARGYSWGAVVELYWDDWALRVGRASPPQKPNQLPVGLQLDHYYGDQVEVEHQHSLFGLKGAVRLLGFRNRENMARFQDAIDQLALDPARNATTCDQHELFNYGSQNPTAPDLCWARKPNVKVGIGLNLEQHLTADIGVFARAMYADGETEVQAYTSSDRSVSLGVLAQGSAWKRPLDVAGVGGAMAWISASHAAYLKLGGVDGFIGDGSITAAPESVIEVFYSVNLLKVLWLTVDYQHLINPAFNAARGPVDVFAGRVHAEF